MDKDAIKSIRKDIERLAATDNTIATIGAVQTMAEATGDASLAAEADALSQRHYHMLRYIVVSSSNEGLLAEQQDFFSKLERLVMASLRTADAAVGTDAYCAALRFCNMRPEDTLESLFADYISEKDSLENNPAALTDVSRRRKLELIASDIFNRIWTSFYLTPSELLTLETLLKDKRLYHYDRLMWLHAVGLSLLRLPDEGKTGILFSIYEDTDISMAATAMTWLLRVCVQDGGDMVDISVIAERNPDELLEFMSRMLEDPMERSRKLQSVFMSLTGKLRDSLDHKNLDPDKLGDIGTENLSAMEEIEKARRKGDDVTLALVRGLDRFEFFRQPSNWFLPFHTNRSEFAEIVDSEGFVYAQTLEANNGLCSIDKYANLASIVATPPSLRESVINSMVDFATNPAIDLQGQLEAMGSANPATFMSVMHSVLFIFNRINAFNRGIFPPDDPDLSTLPMIIPEGADYDTIVALAHKLDTAGYSNIAFSLMATLAATMPGEDDVPVDFIMFFARLARQNGLLQMALQLLLSFDDARKTGPMLVELADIYSELGRDAEALAMLEKYAERFDSDPEFLMAIGTRRLESGSYDEGLATFYQLNYVLPPDDLSARPRLMQALFLTNDYEGAVAEGDVVADGLSDPELLAYYISSLWMSGRRTKALEPARRLASALGDEFDERWTDFVDHLRETLADQFPFLDTIPDILRYAGSNPDFINL